MIMELPERFKLPFAEVVNGELKIYRLERFEDMIYELTYAIRKKRCVYCGKKLTRTNSTLDHRYPRDTGGISITNNLFPCCSKCNSNKSNLTHEEYLKAKDLSKKERKRYTKEIFRYREKIMRKIGFKLPRKWVTFENINMVKYQKSEQDLRGKKYHRIVEFYEKYHKLPRPIIVDKNNHLLDGYNIIVFAKDFKIQTIPVIKLENVELVNN